MRTIKFLTTLIPEDMYNQVSMKSTYNMQDAANALQWHLHEGLCKNYQQDIEILNVLPVGSFPQYYSDAFIKKETFRSETGNNNENIGFCNVKLIRKYVLPNQIYRALSESFLNVDEGILFVYTISAMFMEATIRLKREKPGIKVCAIIADLPDMSSLSSKKSWMQEWFEKHLANKAYQDISCVDAYVLLTKHMADYLKIDKPFCVVEGISTADTEFSEERRTSFGAEKTIMYTGTLHRRFGILNLVSAFTSIEDDSYRLVICGTGDSEKEIREASKLDPRIRFLGQLPRKAVLTLQSSATVLVNPRQNNEEFTKYSFPSKTMEYLSSGIPVVAYRLDGIPDEYEKYLCYVEDDSIQALTNKLVEICQLDKESREEIGRRGRDFVASRKDSITQTKKIVKLLSGLKS